MTLDQFKQLEQIITGAVIESHEENKKNIDNYYKSGFSNGIESLHQNIKKALRAEIEKAEK